MQHKFYVLFGMLLVLFSTTFAQAQSLLKGHILEESTNEPIIGANVIIKKTTDGTITNIDGDFELKTKLDGKQTIVVSFVGMLSKEIDVELNNSTIDLGEIMMKSDAVGLDEVKIIASVAQDRKTPVAVSTVTPKELESKLGNSEFPSVLKSTPGVYTTNDGGGFGDSRITLRGFGNDNIAVMINGIPVNDMENSAVYWSNWAGLSDVTRTMQVQRGMGASKLAVPTAGGTINILTKTTDAEAGGSIGYVMGNDGYQKLAMTTSTGLMSNGWAITLSGSKTVGNGYIDGTAFEGYSYFANISKIINKNHTVAFNAFGAKQWHGQNRSKQLVSTYEDNGRRYNQDWGYLNGEEYNGRANFYSKPQLSLNHYWTLNEKMNIATSLYASFGNGGGQSLNITDNRELYHLGGNVNNPIDFTRHYQENGENGESSLYRIASMNNHSWYGGITTLSWEINEYLNFTGGADVRYYYGEHYQRLDDLIGGEYITVSRNIFGQRTEHIAHVGDKMGYDNDGEVIWGSLFSQLEYSKDNLSAFVNAAAASVNYRRYDYGNYEEGEHISDFQGSNTFSIKSGVNYNLDQHHNVFFNTGYFQRPPMMNAVFMNHTNRVNDEAINEGIFSAEIGYGYRSKTFAANVNAYYTKWMNKSMVRTQRAGQPGPGGEPLPEDIYANILGMNAVHMGVEADVTWKPTHRITVTGMGSVGDWRWANNVDATFFDQNQNQIGDQETLYIKDLKVGNAAQLTAAMGIDYEIFNDFKLGADYVFNGNNYTYFDPAQRTDAAMEGVQALKLPTFGLLDMRANYRFKIGKVDAIVSGNINNVLDAEYIADATDAADWMSMYAYMGMGRTYTIGFKVEF
ncbi:TonB-dependent receptor [Persicobacter psychrovividus]|uniref:TonB-dependent receptor n=1 Tax=Persicobacter psychrovividus TaxID=387638 RepID=A0ABN6LA79_9BACT|nr:TonB-dependent receptor [Persicobacter psychrovividus]